MNSVKVSSWMTFAWTELDLKVFCFLLIQINTLGHQNLKRIFLFFLTTIHYVVKACTIYPMEYVCMCVCACVYCRYSSIYMYIFMHTLCVRVKEVVFYACHIYTAATSTKCLAN